LHAGLPAGNDVTFCWNTTRSCYFLKKVSLAYAKAKAACIKMGGGLVSYNS
jgi:hypothetical protein